jgi:hypothetical protein
MRDRFATCAASATTALLLFALPTLAAAQDPITITGGTYATIPGTFEPGIFSNLAIFISGTGTSGERSTLRIDAPTALQNATLTVTNRGLLEVNADVSADIMTTASFNDGGTLSLLSGTVGAYALTLSGSNAFQRSGGSYTLTNLVLEDGARGSFMPGDAFEGSSFHSVFISSGAEFELGTTLGGTSTLIELAVTGPGSTIQRTTQAMDLIHLEVSNGANLSLLAGDVLYGLRVGSVYDTGTVAPSEVTLAPGTSVMNTIPWLEFGVGGTITDFDAIPYDVEGLTVVGRSLAYRSGTVSDSIAQRVDIRDGGTLTLQQSLSLSGSHAELYLSGSGSQIVTNGHAVSTPVLSLYEGGRLTLDGDITVTGSATSVTLFTFDPALTGSSLLTTGTATGGLSLDSLNITNSSLVLGNLDGTSGPGGWGLRTPNSLFSSLEGWVADGSIVSLSGDPLFVVQDVQYAYVVPEPAAIVIAASGLAGGILLRRRRRRGQDRD